MCIKNVMFRTSAVIRKPHIDLGRIQLVKPQRHRVIGDFAYICLSSNTARHKISNGIAEKIGMPGIVTSFGTGNLMNAHPIMMLEEGHMGRNIRT